MTPEELLEESRLLRQALGRFAKRRDWLEHPDAAALQQRLQRFLRQIQSLGPEGGVPSGPQSFDGAYEHRTLRFVHWNILHGCSEQAVLEALHSDPALRDADLLSLNEVDIGMRRSGNRDIGRNLARALERHGAWCALFLELHGGDTPLPPSAEAEDREALFGLCLLSRYPLARPRRLVLESPSELLFDREGKVGDFVALCVTVLHPRGPFDVVVTHLDVHGTPARRERQMRQILQAVPDGPVILSGDLNATTFPRGNWWRSLRGFATLALSSQTGLSRRLLQPDEPRSAPREPLFGALAEAGFQWSAFNDGRETLDLLLKDVQEVQALPGWLRRAARPVLRYVERRTRHRLDWIAARGFQVAADVPPVTRVEWMRGPRPASDHAPIVCTFTVPERART